MWPVKATLEVVTRRTPRLPRAFVWSVWVVTVLGVLVIWFTPAPRNCPSPCDGMAYVAFGVLQLGVMLLLAAKLIWVVAASIHNRREGSPSIPARPD